MKEPTEEETIANMIEEHDSSVFMKIDSEAFVDLSEEIAFPDIALSFGTHEYNTSKGTRTSPTPLVTYGNFMVIQAEPKKGKSFLMSLFSSALLSKTGQNKYTGELKGHRRDGCIIHVDTEQGRFHAQRMFRRSIDMNESNTELGCYHTYALRSYGYKTRLEWIDWKLKQLFEVEERTIDVVMIDGIADLCADANDINSSREVVECLMRWTEKYNCALITVIHSNIGSKKATGHLGSFLGKKAETILHLDAVPDDDQYTKEAECLFSRNTSIKEPIQYRINRYGKPYILGGNTDNVGTF